MNLNWLQKLFFTCVISVSLTTLAYSFDDSDFSSSETDNYQTETSPSKEPRQGRKPHSVPNIKEKQAITSENQNEDDEFVAGRQIAGSLLGAAKLVKNQRLQVYVNKVGLWIAMQSERPDIKWRFGVLDTHSINAFATPGGYIFITKGLYNLLLTEDELAGVLGHEIAHVVKQHHWEVIKTQKLVAAATNMATSRKKNNTLLQKHLNQGAEILARALDKDAEYESDRMGVILARRAGYDATGLFSVLDRISANSGNDVSLLYTTHPSPVDRSNSLSDTFADNLSKIDGGKQVRRLMRVQ